MTEQLETQVREALAARAAELPRGSGARLRQLDYHPRTRSVRPPVAAGVLVAAGAAAATVALVGLGTNTQEAFAGWSPSPTQAQKGQLTAAEAACQKQAATPLGTAPPGAVKLLKHAPPTIIDTGSLKPALTDTRGPFTFVIFAGSHGSASCITGPSFTWRSASATTGSTSVPAGKVALASTHVTTENGHALSFAEGHTGPNVTDTTLMLDDGTKVEATTSNGWFVAWWPGSHSVKSVLVTTPSGTSTQSVDSANGPGCPKATAGPPAVACSSGSTLGTSGGVVSGSAGGTGSEIAGGGVGGGSATNSTFHAAGSSSGKIHSSK